MKKLGILLLAVVAAAFLLCWRENSTKKRGAAVHIGSESHVSGGGEALPHLGNQSLNQEPSSHRHADDILASVRRKLLQLERVSKSDKGAEDEIMTNLLAVLTDGNAEEITRGLSAEEKQSRFGIAALQRWLKVAPAVAADWVATQKDVSEEQAWAVAHQLVEDQASLDLYCARLPESAWRQLFLKQAALASVQKDPTEALLLAQRINSSDAQLDLLQTTVSTWIVENPAAASRWIAQVQNPFVKEELTAVGARALAGTDPVGAIGWLSSNLPASSDRAENFFNETLEEILGSWAETNPAKAAQMVSQLPSGDLRRTTTNLVWQHWNERDPVAAAAWIKTLPERDRM